MAVVPFSDDMRALATQVGPVHLRTLDAIHLASALTLGADLGALLTYDVRMPDAAVQRDVAVLAPE